MLPKEGQLEVLLGGVWPVNPMLGGKAPKTAHKMIKACALTDSLSMSCLNLLHLAAERAVNVSCTASYRHNYRQLKTHEKSTSFVYDHLPQNADWAKDRRSTSFFATSDRFKPGPLQPAWFFGPTGSAGTHLPETDTR
jgi:hypothetical protein